MIDLPRDLAPWAPLLGLFPADLAAGLAAWLPRLALAIGPMRASRPTGDGDPDGFTGIARRGSYERLLLTEWLLADELPDEFLRRAANGEHAFFQLARRSPARARSSVVLFDAGPDQLGAPRLAHLAALIVLAARAERAGARFAWSLLHQPDRPLFTEVTPQSVRSLLAARTAIPPSDDDARAWAERARQSDWEDAWIVGAASTVPGWKHGTLAVRDVLDPGRRALALVVRAPAAPPREIELDLPPDRAAARLLRDPFAVAAPAPAPQRGAGAPISNLVFAANGSKVFARAASGEILSFPVPNSPNAPAGRPRRYRPRSGGVVAAVGWVSRGLVMLTITEREIVLEHTVGGVPDLLHGRVPISDSLAVAAPQPADPLAPLVHVADGDGEVCFTDARRALHRIRRVHDASPRGDDLRGVVHLERVAVEVSAIAPIGGRFAYVGRDLSLAEPGVRWLPSTAPRSERTGWHLVTHGGPDVSPHIAPLDGDGTFEACFGVIYGGQRTQCLVAVQERGDRWLVREEGEMIADRAPPPEARVVGPWRRARGGAAELIVLEPDQRTVTLLSGDGPRPLSRAAAPIVDVVLSTARSQLAYVTTAGEVVVYSLVHDAPLARFLHEAV